MFQWVAPGIIIPIKTVAADNSWVTEYKNIKKGRQPVWLFEIPKGYKKFFSSETTNEATFEGLLSGGLFQKQIEKSYQE